ncbi:MULTISPECIES: hypothetical protein [unclassified Xanthobacter]|uniref:hypothetical protein n=1 Tax=Xanthobacter TaxID=279 RepID=UPI001F3DC4F7|nr:MULTISPECIES: hypothetical protein [unclassified Xanthobacter]
MSAVTYPAKSFSLPRDVAAASAVKPERGFWGRMFDALIAARTAQAEREVARYLAHRGQDFRDLSL